MKKILLILSLIPAICNGQADSSVVKVPRGTPTSLTPASVGLDTVRTNVWNALNGKQDAGSYATLSGAQLVTGKTFGMFNYAADAGNNDSYAITLSPAITSYAAGLLILFKANTANTTGCSLNVNGLGAKNIVKRLNTTLATGDILAGMTCMVVYDGTNFIIMNPVVN